MGLFDTFVGKIKCPYCGHEIKFSEQTKQFDCLLHEFKLGDYIDKGNANYFYRFQWPCKQCKEDVNIFAGIRRGQLIGYYTDISNLDILHMENIEEGYERNLEYEEMCKNGYGYDKSVYTSKPYGTGQKIYTLKTEWIIDKVYKEVLKKIDTPSSDFFSLLYHENWCYLVHDEYGHKRFIVTTPFETNICHLPDEEADKYPYYKQSQTELIEYKE